MAGEATGTLARDRGNAAGEGEMSDLSMPMSGFEWQSIKTAPRRPLDNLGYGPTVLLFVNGKVGIGFWDEEFDRFYVEYPECRRADPTHWMLFPEPPK
jgi:hypothetical protein